MLLISADERTDRGKYYRDVFQGNEYRDIEDQVRKMYGVEISQSTVSGITNRVLIKNGRPVPGTGLFLPAGWMAFSLGTS